MNEPEMNSPVSSELGEQVAALQRQVFTLLLALIVTSGTLTVYLFWQSRSTAKEIQLVNTQIIQPFNQKRVAIEGFLNQLAAYGQKNPDFQQQVLKKYGLTAVPPKTQAPKK
jgi:hypothetical protein